MSEMSDTEINTYVKEFEIFGMEVPIKNAAIAIAFTIVSGAAGTIWAAADFMHRLDLQEEAVVEASDSASSLSDQFDSSQKEINKELIDIKKETTADIAAFATRIEKVEQALQTANVQNLQGKLAELGTNLNTILQQQQTLITLRDKVDSLELSITEMRTIVDRAELATKDANELKQKIDRAQKEVEDLWEAMDYLSNPI